MIMSNSADLAFGMDFAWMRMAEGKTASKKPFASYLPVLLVLAVLALAAGVLLGKGEVVAPENNLDGGDTSPESQWPDEQAPNGNGEDSGESDLVTDSTELEFRNCVYDGFQTLTCDTNCEEVGTVIVAITDSEDHLAQSLGGDISDGTMVISDGKISVSPKYTQYGDTVTYALAELSDPGTWIVAMSCSSPESFQVLNGV